MEEDIGVIDDPKAGPRQKVAARLLRIEKSILGGYTSTSFLIAACEAELLLYPIPCLHIHKAVTLI